VGELAEGGLADDDVVGAGEDASGFTTLIHAVRARAANDAAPAASTDRLKLCRTSPRGYEQVLPGADPGGLGASGRGSKGETSLSPPRSVREHNGYGRGRALGPLYLAFNTGRTALIHAYDPDTSIANYTSTQLAGLGDVFAYVLTQRMS
jgi:hypothetical protein